MLALRLAGGFIYNQGQAIPFTFGVPFTVHLHLQSYVLALCCVGNPALGVLRTAIRMLTLTALKIELADGTDASGATVIETVVTPEPTSFPLMLAALGMLWAKTRRKD